MKTCPACHRAVPDNAATCPHPDCGHHFGAPSAGIKRPPPPHTTVQATGGGARGASSLMAAKQLLSKIPKPWQRPLVLLATILLTSGLTATLTAVLLRGGQKQEVAAAKGIAPQAEPKAAAKATEPGVQQPPADVDQATRRQGDKARGAAERQSDTATRRQGDTAKAQQRNVESSATEHDGAPKQDSPPKPDGAAKQDGAVELDGAASPPKADAPPKRPSDDNAPEPLDLEGETRKAPAPMPEPLTGLVDEPKPELLGGGDSPKLPVIADTPEGLYAVRTKPKTAEFLADRGGTIESQKAVEDGLNWLARHQGADGHWGADCLSTGPHSRCNRNAPCRGTGWQFDVAHTGLALLAFQAAGHYHFNGQKYSGQVSRGIAYLVGKQSPQGSFLDPQIPNPQERAARASSHMAFMYEHAIATFALCDACAAAVAEGKKPNPGLQLAAQLAVSYIENLQHDDGGWRYLVAHNELSDSSVTGWVMFVLKTAREAKLNVSPKTISRMMEYFSGQYVDGRTEYYVIGNNLQIPPGVIYEGSPDDKPSTLAMTAVGMLAVEFFEHKLDSPVVQAGAATLADQAKATVDWGAQPGGAQVGALGMRFPDMRPRPFNKNYMSGVKNYGYYLWYHCTMAMFQVGGEPWKRWNDAVRDHVIGLQVADVRKLEKQGLRVIGGPPGDEDAVDCERGSWPPGGDAFGDWGGRIYTTAMAVLTLEVYYRYPRVAGQPEKEKFFEK